MSLVQVGAILFLSAGVLVVFGLAFRDEVKENNLRHASQGVVAMVVVVGHGVPLWFMSDAVLDNWGEWPLILLGWPIYLASLGLSVTAYWFIFGVVWKGAGPSD
ncbi:MAG: hypothetical protein IH865_13255 [Chloroflexi bacterium]|nr:hypothetical protein [Chloroflexota bacterium]